MTPIKPLQTHLPKSASTGVVRTVADGIAAWLERYDSHTARGHKKEVARLFLWLEMNGKSIEHISTRDASAFYAFLTNPPANLVGPARRRCLSDGSINPDWRPFVKPLAPASVQQTSSTLSAMCKFLIDEGLLERNPFRAARLRGARRRATAVERWIDERDWAHVLRYLDEMPDVEDPRQRARARWAMLFLYRMGARRFEAAKAAICDIVDVRGKLWWKTVGKGSKLGRVPFPASLLAEWERFRAVFGNLPAIPSSSTEALIPRLNGGYMTDKMIYLIVQQVMRRAALWIEEENPVAATRLRIASTHWLRHTSASHQLYAGISLKTVQENMRHADIKTTSIYVHAADDRRHEETEEWCNTVAANK